MACGENKDKNEQIGGHFTDCTVGKEGGTREKTNEKSHCYFLVREKGTQKEKNKVGGKNRWKLRKETNDMR